MKIKTIIRKALCITGGIALAWAVPSLAQQDKTPKEADVQKMQAALPDAAPAKPKQARKVLVFGLAKGFKHSSIPLGCQTIVEMGKKTGAYEGTISYDPDMFESEKLKPFDAIVLMSTTGDFLDSPDKDQTQKRRAALIDYVKGGKGLMGIHAAADAYYDWPEYGELIGGYFNGHPWGHVTIKIDDPHSPIIAGFDGKDYTISDETYTYKMVPWSRQKLHILTSLDMSKMSEADRQKENRPDHDYGISWIHTFGSGRVFYCAHGHSEHVYWDRVMLKEYLAGLQYALGDLDAKDHGASARLDAGR